MKQSKLFLPLFVMFIAIQATASQACEFVDAGIEDSNSDCIQIVRRMFDAGEVPTISTKQNTVLNGYAFSAALDWSLKGQESITAVVGIYKNKIEAFYVPKEFATNKVLEHMKTYQTKNIKGPRGLFVYSALSNGLEAEIRQFGNYLISYGYNSQENEFAYTSPIVVRISDDI